MKSNEPTLKKATFAGGCFWCSEADFSKHAGVVKIVSGYTGGHTPDPTYQEVCSGRTGHVEAVQIIYDEKLVSYQELLEIFWRHVDPTDPGGQFADRGPQYRTMVFYHDEEQKRAAEASRRFMAESGRFRRKVVTEIVPAVEFYPAEQYHQEYYLKNPLRYLYYRSNSGRDQFLQSTWGEEDHPPHPSAAGSGRPSRDSLRRRLTALQFEVTQNEGTEPPFDNSFWDHKAQGIYVDIVSGEPLFSSTDKFDSGTGWPSFSRALEPGNITQKEDRRLLTARTEVRSRQADSHLGHLFNDGPPPAGLRYCINSAALRFVPKEKMAEEGYGRYLELFER